MSERHTAAVEEGSARQRQYTVPCYACVGRREVLWRGVLEAATMSGGTRKVARQRTRQNPRRRLGWLRDERNSKATAKWTVALV